MRSPPQRTALRLGLLYIAIASLWIVFSDRLLASLTADPRLLTRLQTLKGWGFVACTGLLLYVMVRRAFARIARGDLQVQMAEHTLRETEAFLRLQSAALEAADNAVAIADRDGRITWVNSAFTRLTGYSAAEAVGQTLQLRQPAADRETWQAILAGRPWHGEGEAVRKDGTRYVEEQSITPVPTAAGAIGHVIAISGDISARKKADAALAEERSLLRTLIDNLPDCIFIKDQESRFILINKAEAGHLGVRSPEDAVGKTDLDFLPAALARQYRADEERIVRTGEPLLGREERASAPRGGEPAWHLTTKVPLRDAGGAIVGLVGISRNITDVKRAEETLFRHTRQLEAIRIVSAEITRELRLAALLDLITRRAAELVGSVSGTLYLWDAGAQMLIGQASIGAKGSEIRRVRRLDEGVAGTVAARRRGMIVNDYRRSPLATPESLTRPGVTAVIAEPLVYRERLAGVIALDNEGTGRRFTPEDGEVLALFAAQAAITVENARLYEEVKQSLRHLEEAQDELVRSEKLRALGQMSAGVAHDVNNTLAAILGQVELMQLQTTDPALRESLGILAVAATDGAQVVRRLQAFARQQPAGALTPCDLARTVSEALEITRPRWRDDAQRRGCLIEVKTALAGLPPVWGQASEIREALTNLVLNAVDAMPGGGTLTIAARLTDTGADRTAPPDAEPAVAGERLVELAIADTGIGMTEAVRRRVFEPFFTTKEGYGTGLGLSMVYGIMERHGGQVDVASTPGHGTTFTLRFRAVPAEPSAPPAPTPGRHPSRRLLVIDDDPHVRRTLVGLLQAAGHQVLDAGSARDGLARFAPDEIDLVLTDLGMPEVNGWDVAAAIKARRPTCPVVLLTGWGDRQADEDGARGMVDRVLGKPVRLQDLLQAIGDLTPDA